MTVKCINCGKEFKTYPSDLQKGRGLFCSRECRSGKFNPMFGKHFSEEQKKKWRRGKRPEFTPWNKGKSLSQEHKDKVSKSLIQKFKDGFVNWNKGKKGVQKHSEETKRKISERHRGKTLSVEARRKVAEANRGEKNHNWRGGITSLYERIRHSMEYREWRTSIFERDDFTCQLCKKRSGQLQVDHWPTPFWKLIKDNNINSLEDALVCEKLWDKSANRTLCEGCHKKTETYGWGAANQKQEMEKLMTLLAIHKATTIKIIKMMSQKQLALPISKNDLERSVN